jgi:hypothetical protein
MEMVTASLFEGQNVKERTLSILFPPAASASLVSYHHPVPNSLLIQ